MSPDLYLMRRLFIVPVLILLLAAGAVAAPPDPDPPGDEVTVVIEFASDSQFTASPGTSFDLYGNVTYENPYESDLTVDLDVSAGTWRARIIPDNFTVTDEMGGVEFTVRVTVPGDANATESIRASGRWTSGDREGNVFPDTVQSVVVRPGESHDSGPNDMMMLAAVTTTAAAGAIALGYATWAVMKKLPPIVPPFYSRLKKADIVGHEARHQILNRLEAEPGMTLGSIVDELGDSRSTVMYHLRVLEKEGLVRSQREGRSRLFYPHGAPAHPHIEVEDSILQTVILNPGSDISEIARELGTSKQLISYHVNKLSSSGRLWVEMDGRRKRCYPRET